MLLIFFILAVSTVFCLLAFSTDLFMTHYYFARRKNNERLVLSFGFIWFVLDVIVFVYNRLKQSLILQTNANRFLQIFFSHRNLICIYFFKKAYCAYSDLDASLQLCVSHLFASLVLLRKFVLCQGHVPGLTRKKKLTKFVYFLETTIYECLIFWTNIMVSINLVVNF